MTCIITGIKVFDEAHQRTAPADLYAVGDCYVIRANRNRNGYIFWHYEANTADIMRHHMVITLNAGYEFFKGDGVIVTPQAHTTLNDTAQEYLSK